MKDSNHPPSDEIFRPDSWGTSLYKTNSLSQCRWLETGAAGSIKSFVLLEKSEEERALRSMLSSPKIKRETPHHKQLETLKLRAPFSWQWGDIETQTPAWWHYYHEQMCGRETRERETGSSLCAVERGGAEGVKSWGTSWCEWPALPPEAFAVTEGQHHSILMRIKMSKADEDSRSMVDNKVAPKIPSIHTLGNIFLLNVGRPCVWPPGQ